MNCIARRVPRSVRRYGLAALTLPVLALLSGPAHAQQQPGLPQMENPTRPGGTTIIEILRNYAFDIVMLIALLVCAAMFVGVCYHAYVRYSDIHSGRGTWGEFGLTVAVGALLLVVGIWLLGRATAIL